MNRWIGFGVGLMAFVAAHSIEVMTWNVWFGGAHDPWFLNSGRATLCMVSWLCGISLVAGVLGLSGLMVAAGAFTAMTMVLFLKEGGAGTIFPIVMALGGLVILMAGTLGASIGTEIARALRARR